MHMLTDAHTSAHMETFIQWHSCSDLLTHMHEKGRCTHLYTLTHISCPHTLLTHAQRLGSQAPVLLCVPCTFCMCAHCRDVVFTLCETASTELVCVNVWIGLMLFVLMQQTTFFILIHDCCRTSSFAFSICPENSKCYFGISSLFRSMRMLWDDQIK